MSTEQQDRSSNGRVGKFDSGYRARISYLRAIIELEAPKAEEPLAPPYDLGGSRIPPAAG